MLSSSSKTTTSTDSASKTVSTSTNVTREESKTPETETVEQSEMKNDANDANDANDVNDANKAQDVQNECVVTDKVSTSSPKSKTSSKVTPSKKKLNKSPLSKRALKVKQSLSKQEMVDAVLLKPDGSQEQIKYNTSSKQANKLLNGRPTIIGELEEIQVIVVRSLNSNARPLNQNILPVPFCNKQYNGNYLLYRVDAKGNPINLSLKQYQQYVEKNKTLTEQARKNYDPVENQEIKTQSTFTSDSRLTLVYLRSEVDKKVRSEFKAKNGRNPTDSEIEETVNETLEQLINELVSTSSSSPMNDPDYNPNDEDKENEIKYSEQEILTNLREIYKQENGVDINNKDLMLTIENTQRLMVESKHKETEFIDDRDWRLQLNDALNYVRARGRLDGKILAEKISETFYELNGVEPSLEQLIDVFRRIKSELANEAKQELMEQQQQSDKQQYDDDGTAYCLAKQLDFNNADPSDLVEYAFRIVREDLISRSKSSFLISKGRLPTKSELKETVEKLALKLAQQAMDYMNNDKDMAMMMNMNMMDDDNKDDDPDYDPNNAMDKKLAHCDKLEDEQFNDDYFNLRMLTTPRIKSKTGVSEKYDVYFCNFTPKREEKNLLKAIESFKMRNHRQPNDLEINRLKQFLSTTKDTTLVQFKLSVISDSEEMNDEEKNDVLDDKMSKNTKKGSSLSVPQQKHKQSTTPTKVLVTPIKKKKSAARYNVYFEDNKLDQTKNEKQAIKWFKQFNNRNPTDLELAGIKQFVKADKSELIECEYQVPVDMNDVNEDDMELKQTEDDDKVSKKMKTDGVVNKKLATKYTLNFDDEQERENGDEKQALKWFKRFNNRDPTDTEQEKIKQFVQNDNADDTIDID